MAIQIPLNKFRRVSSLLTTTPRIIYTAPFDRASILLTTLVTNLTSREQTVTIGISGTKPEQILGYSPSDITLINRAIVGGFDTANLTIGKVVLIDGDAIYASSSAGLSSASITISILEAVNTD